MAFDPATETARYIDSLGPEALQKAESYTIATHWMLLAGLVVTAIVTWIVVRSGLLDRLSVKLHNRGWALRIWTICVAFFVISAVISLPWGIYEQWGFERSYGRTDQPLSDFLAQNAIGITVSSILGGLFFLGVYALIRRAGKTWWIWSGGLAAVPAGAVRTALLEMADEANIPHDRVLMFDGSRQSNNFTANVSGVFGSARIAISDVALKQASLDEVKAVTGHEIGHYVLGHVWRMVFAIVFIAMLGFFLADRLFNRVAALFGSKATIGDPEGLPILLLIVSVLGLFAQPVVNSVTRVGESEADAYSLRTANLPDALAGALVKTAEYRYPRPSALQEVIFYSHPSVENRVRRAMEWKAEQLKKAEAR